MPLDREDTLKKAEKLVRVGRLDAAIAEYERIVEAFPSDWNSANVLGDLYARAGRADRAAAEWGRVANSLFADGFMPRSAALYKKILKVQPNDEAAMLQLAEVAVQQGLLVEARSHLNAVADHRAARGDRSGVEEIRLRLASVGSAEAEARRKAGRLRADGDKQAAARQLKEAAMDLVEKRRIPEALATLRDALDITPEDPSLTALLLEAHSRAGNAEESRAIVSELLATGRRDDVLAIAWRLCEDEEAAAFLCLEPIVDALSADERWADAAALLHEFSDRRPHFVPALLRLIELCLDGGMEQAMCNAQARLADAYLAAGRAAEARSLAEDLVAQEPWDEAHLSRLRQALVMLREPDPDGVIAKRLGGDVPFTTSAPFVAAPAHEPPPAGDEWPSGPSVPDDQTSWQVYNLQNASVEIERFLDEQRDASAVDAPPAVEIDLTDALGELMSGSTPMLKEFSMTGDDPLDDRRNLDEVFREFRDEVARDTSAESASEHLALAKAYQDMGMPEKAIEALEVAARSPRHRFEAASMLGQLWRAGGQLTQAIEWLERAAEAPAPSVEEGRAVLYDLGDMLEQSGETMRALAVFLELQADAGSYRDVNTRVERLSNLAR